MQYDNETKKWNDKYRMIFFLIIILLFRGQCACETDSSILYVDPNWIFIRMSILHERNLCQIYFIFSSLHDLKYIKYSLREIKVCACIIDDVLIFPQWTRRRNPRHLRLLAANCTRQTFTLMYLQIWHANFYDQVYVEFFLLLLQGYDTSISAWHLEGNGHVKMGCTSHYNDVKMGAMTSQITSLTIVYSTVYSRADQRKQQSTESLAFVWGIPRWPENSPHKWPVTRKMFPFDNVTLQLFVRLPLFLPS